MYIKSSLHAFEVLKKYFKNAHAEEFWVMALSHQLKNLGTRAIAKGTLDHCSIHPRDVFLYAIEKNSAQILIAHNHIESHPWPSKEDIQLTKKLVEIGHFLQIPIIDHIIVNEDQYTSFTDYNWFNINSKK